VNLRIHDRMVSFVQKPARDSALTEHDVAALLTPRRQST